MYRLIWRDNEGKRHTLKTPNAEAAVSHMADAAARSPRPYLCLTGPRLLFEFYDQFAQYRTTAA